MDFTFINSLRNYPLQNPARLYKNEKRRTLSVVDEEPSEAPSVIAVEPVDGARAPTRKHKGVPPSIAIPSNEDLLQVCEVEKYNPPVSPVPLPPGVTGIDDDENGMRGYGLDTFIYAKQRETKFRECLLNGKANINVKFRNKLVDWLMQAVHFFRVHQETVYVAINLLDKVLADWIVRPRNLQLVGIACVLMATKFEEYYCVDIDALIHCTKNSYSRKDVLKMELEICRRTGFDCYGEQPMIFVDRFILAADREGDGIFRHLVTLFLDSIMSDFDSWIEPASLKSAAAVYSALLFDVSDFEEAPKTDEVWSPNLRYYSGYEKSDLVALSSVMLQRVYYVKEVLESDENVEDVLDGDSLLAITTYQSKSRHCAILSKLSCKDLGAAILAVR